MPIRSPIITVVGHVDHGKSTLLDKIRETTVQEGEAGGITQCIGATEIPTDKIKDISRGFMNEMGIELKIPGILAIDTPGHEAFTNLRKRGGSVADLAILVIDVNKGIQPQTEESIKILKRFKVPFVIACTKIDLIPGWKQQDTLNYLKSIKKQPEEVRERLKSKIYELMGGLGEFGINANLFHKVDDYQKTVAMIPCSGITGEGVSELLVMISGLSQKFLKKDLEIREGRAKGSVLEVKTSKGLGTVIDVILYDGVLKKNDYLITMSEDEPVVTKIRALLKPTPLQEIRDKKCSFERAESVVAARGIRIVAPSLNNVIAGMPVETAETEEEARELAERMKQEVEALIKEDDEGLVVKADSLGSLEALVNFLRSNGVKIVHAGVGDVNKRDVIKSTHMQEENIYYGMILGFNTGVNEDAGRLAEVNNIRVRTSNIIYKLLEEYEEWRRKRMEEEKRKELEKITLPAKVQVLGDFIFRKSKPAVVGVHVLKGTIKPRVPLMKETGERIGIVKQLQKQGVTIPKGEKGDKIACSITGATYEKDFVDNEILYTDINEEDFLKIKRRLKAFLSKEEIQIVKEIAEIKRKKRLVWGV